jgi:hypothetical protein
VRQPTPIQWEEDLTVRKPAAPVEDDATGVIAH